MYKHIKIVSLVLLFSFLLVLPAMGSSYKSENLSEKAIDARYNKIHSIMRKVHEKKITQEQADKILANMGVYRRGKAIKNPQLESDAGIGILSNEEYAINLPTVIPYYDSATGYHYVGAHFFWNDPAYWEADFPSPWIADPGIGVDIGGDDGFGIVFSNEVLIKDETFDTYSSDGTRYSYTTVTDRNQYGVVYNKQDVGFKETDGSYEYTWDSGYLGAYFLPQNPGESIGIWQEMTHTWEDTGVTLNGISTNGIQWDWTSTQYQWKASGNSTIYTP